MPPSTRRIHLDHAASSPLVEPAREALLANLDLVGNPAALHASGRAARAVLEDAREQLAEAVGARAHEVVFTSGGSEANTLALHAATSRQHDRASGPTDGTGAAVLVGATEHPSVAGAARMTGVGVLRCDQDGLVDLDDLTARLGDGAALVSVMSVNNETGTYQDLEDVGELCRAAGAWLHTDAVQALGHVPFDFSRSPADLASLSAHKVGGPVGIGALLARREVALAPWGLGGGQERQVRSGTQPVLLAAAFAAAASHAVARREHEAARLAGLREQLVAGLLAGVEDVRVNGAAQHSPAICNVTLHGTRADDVLMLLDMAGIDCSTGSACRAGVHQPSEVLLAMGRSLDDASASVRFSLGPETTQQDVEQLLAVLPGVVQRARSAARG